MILSTTLFPLPSESASTNKELSCLRDKYPKLDATYLNVHMRDDWKKAKDFFDVEWEKYQQFSDKGFDSQFQKVFSARAWEIYLFHLLRVRGFQILLQNKSRPNPDFKIKINNVYLFIEAVTPNKGDNHNEVPKISNGIYAFDTLNHPKVRRILNSLDEKIKQYRSKHIKAVSKDDYYVIAINGGEIQGNMNPEDLILEVVGGVNPTRNFPHNNDGTLGSVYHTKRQSIANALGTNSIDLDIFQKEIFNEVSGLIYFGKDTVNAILQNSPNEEIIFVHNPSVVENKKIGIDVFSCFKQIIQVQNGWLHLMPGDEKLRSDRDA